MAEENELSEREREILRLVATGASNKEIAYTLVISPNTVKVHLRNIFAKVGVASRTEATLYAIRSGLLPAPSAVIAPVMAPEQEAEEEVQEEPEPTAAVEPLEAGNTELEVPAEIPRRRWVLRAALVLSIVALAALGMLLLRQPEPPAPVSTQPPAAQLPARWSTLPALPEAVQDLAGAVYAEKIYVTGGESTTGVSGHTWRYNPGEKTWTARADKPTPVSQVSAALLGEKIYVPGGRGADGQPSRVVEVYDPRADRWEQAAELPEARSAYALAALEGRLYLFGGWDGQKVVSSVYVYDPQQNAWAARADLPTARSFASAAAVSGKIFILGGWDGSKAMDRVDAYYPSRDKAGETPWESGKNLPEPRFAAGSTAIAEVVYVVGGEGDPGGKPPAPLQLAPQTGQWSDFEQPPNPTGGHLLLLPLENHLHSLTGTTHQAYQAIYNLAFPVIQ